MCLINMLFSGAKTAYFKELREKVVECYVPIFAKNVGDLNNVNSPLQRIDTASLTSIKTGKFKCFFLLY